MSQTPHSSLELVTSVIDKGKVNGQQLLVIGLCLMFNMLDGFDITAMAVAVNAIGNEMQLGTDQLGLVFSFALGGMMLGAMFLASISDLIGRRKTIILSVVIVGITVLMTGFATALWQLIILRFISGLGAGAMLASQATLAAEYSSSRLRALSVTAVTAGYPLGAMLTGFVASAIIPEHGWRAVFWLGGGLTLAMAVVALLLLPESLQYLLEKRPANALQKINTILQRLKKPTLTELPALEQRDQATPDSAIANMRALLQSELRVPTLTLWLSFFFCFAALYFLMSWIPKMMVDAGWSSDTGNLAFSLFNLGGVLGTLFLGSLAMRFKLSNVIMVFLLLAAAAMLAFAASPRHELLLLSLIFFIGLMQQGGFTGLYAVSAKLYPTAIRSTGVGWAIGLGRLGAVVGPAVAGFTIAGGFSMADNFYLFAIPLAISGFIAFYLRID
jgi:benzoate transport